MNKVVKNFAAAAALTLSVTAAFAQTSAPLPAPKKPGLLSRLFHPKPKPGLYQSNGSAMHPMGSHPMMGHPMMGHPMMGGSMMGGRIIGNKNSHVYHMPGDGGSLPAPQNRVYFSSAAAAQAAGYHAAGGGRAMMHGTMPRGGAQVYH